MKNPMRLRNFGKAVKVAWSVFCREMRRPTQEMLVGKNRQKLMKTWMRIDYLG